MLIAFEVSETSNPHSGTLQLHFVCVMEQFKVPITVVFSPLLFNISFLHIILQVSLEILERHAVYVDSGQRDSRALAFRRAACALKSYPKYVILSLTINT